MRYWGEWGVFFFRDGEFWAKVQNCRLSFPPLFVLSSIEYHLVVSWWPTSKARSESLVRKRPADERKSINAKLGIKVFSIFFRTAAVRSCQVDGRRIIQMTWDSLRRLNSQLAFQWPTSTNWANLQWRPDRRYEVCRRHPFECFSIKPSPDDEDCDAAPLTSQWSKRL